MIIDQSAREAGDRRLVDGGVVNSTPISHAVELGAERIYVADRGSGVPSG